MGETRNTRNNFDRIHYDTNPELRHAKYGARIRNELSESENVSVKRFSGSETQDCTTRAEVTLIIIDCSL